MKKVCKNCGVEKDEELFRKKLGKYCGVCKECTYAAAKLAPSYKRLSKSNNYQVKKRKLIQRYKSMCGCKICGIKFAECLDLHHVDPSTKEYEPSNMCSLSMDKIRAEIRKCVVLCSNHHRMVHSGRIVL